MDKYLKIIYDDYYNLKRTLDFACDRDVIQFVYFLSKYNINGSNIENIVKAYKKEKSKEYKDFIEKINSDSYFSARETLHFTYPLNETFKRLDVLFEMIGDKKWNEIFGYSYEFLYTFVTVVICRIVLFHNLNEIEPNEGYANSDAKECYFTKDELNKYLQNSSGEIDLVLNDLSVNFSELSNVKDVYKIIAFNEHYYLFFIWDFLYNLFNIYSIKIKSVLGNDEFNKKRGKAFETVCYNNLNQCFNYGKIYKGLEYDYKSGNHEIDILMELNKVVVIFECKSGAFDSLEFENDSELYSAFVKVYGNGYKTINDLNDYILEGNNTFRDKDKNNIEIDIKNKSVVYVNLSLYNIEFIQTSIQKIKSARMKKVDVYPICWNYIDFLTLTKVAIVDYELFEEYLKKRFNIINNYKNLTLDYDEVDAFGLLTDPSQKHFVDNILLSESTSNSNIDMNFMISNGIYREEFNSGLDRKYLLGFINENTGD